MISSFRKYCFENFENLWKYNAWNSDTSNYAQHRIRRNCKAKFRQTFPPVKNGKTVKLERCIKFSATFHIDRSHPVSKIGIRMGRAGSKVGEDLLPDRRCAVIMEIQRQVAYSSDHWRRAQLNKVLLLGPLTSLLLAKASQVYGFRRCNG